MFHLQKLCNGTAALLFLSLLAMVRKIAPRGPCDPLVPEYCQLPFPNSFFTIPSPHTPTGVQVNFSTHSFPVDVFGRLTNLTEWNTFGKRLCVRVWACCRIVGGARLLCMFPSSSPHPTSIHYTGISICISTSLRLNPHMFHTDGFSPFPSILTYFPALSDANLPPHWDMQQSLKDDCPTVLLDMEKGGHFI